MKLKLNQLHIIGISAFLAGIGVLIFGMVILFKCLNIQDLSKLKFDDIKSGTYVKGQITTVVKGYPVGATDYNVEPYEIYTTDSDEISEGAYTSYFLMGLENDPGKYVCVIIDQYRDTDLYHQIFTNNIASDNVPYDVEGIVTCRKVDKERVTESVKNWNKKYSDLYYNTKYASDVSLDNVSDCIIEIRPLGTRKFWWLYSIPLLFAGVSVFILGGRPYERIK